MRTSANYFKTFKRKILFAEGEAISFANISTVLGAEYDILYARDGKQALELIKAEKSALSLLLLDLSMPKLSGFDVLRMIGSDSSINNIPIIVITSEQDEEAESLSLGATDFISRPFLMPDVIRARVKRTIEFAEEKEIIKTAEYDALTGLYNKDFFFTYCDKLDLLDNNKKVSLYLSLHKFHTINELYGHEYSNNVLTNIAKIIKNYLSEHRGIAARENENFLIYVEEVASYHEFLNYVLDQYKKLKSTANVTLRMGVYGFTDEYVAPAKRFDRAKFACESVKSLQIADFLVYDDDMREKEELNEKLVYDFDQALANKEFEVYFQPKFKIDQDQVCLSSAEALIRWNHKELGMISPGVFIPLFEDNGLIEQLDAFVWEQSASKIKEWREFLHRDIPVSVNVSRVDMLNNGLKEEFLNLIDKYGLKPGDLILEITESAYTTDAKRIVSVVKELRDSGFYVVMDDFGSGYSSLNMITSLPLDAIKIDIAFIKNMFNSPADFRMVQFVIDITRFLKIPVVAEGVETVEQFNALKLLGCDIIQGFYFSKPLCAKDFEDFILTH